MYCVKENNKDKGGLDSSFVWLQSRDSDSRDWWVKEYRDVLIYMSVYGCLLPLLPPSLHSCCQGTGVALIFLPLVRYVETQANPQTCVLFFCLSFCFLPRSVLRTPADLLVVSAFYQREEGGAVFCFRSFEALTCTESDSVEALSQLSPNPPEPCWSLVMHPLSW